MNKKYYPLIDKVYKIAIIIGIVILILRFSGRIIPNDFNRILSVIEWICIVIIFSVLINYQVWKYKNKNK